jgi:hypothetical protein
MKKIVTLLLMLTLIFIFIAYLDDTVDQVNAVPASQTASVANDNDDEDSSFDTSKTSYVTLNGNSITLKGSGAIVEGRTITITSAGTYNISGTLDNGQIIVNTKDKEKVKLVLNGVDITCSESSPIYVINADKTEIKLEGETKNYITDSDSYILDNAESNEPNAAIFSNDDLTIKGKGLLTVNANYKNGIQSKDDLKITNGNITINAVNDGIKGRDSISIKKGNIIVNAGGDGIQSDNDVDSEKGHISIKSGTINITAGGDGIQAKTDFIISGGTITISSGGGSGNSSNYGGWGGRDRRFSNYNNSSTDSKSTKGIKAGVDLTIEGGIINVDSSDDSLNADKNLTINGGNIILASGDDGIRTASDLEINGGNINITKCYEGIEGSNITINNGNVNLLSNDDGINVVSAEKSMYGGRRRGGFEDYGNNYLNINGGYIAVDAYGDGLDINGSTNMTGGVLIVNGPISDYNGALDSGGFQITGGFLVAVGSAGMAQAPSSSSTQYSVMVNLSSQQPAGTIIHIETEDGKGVLSCVPTKAYQSIVLSTPKLRNGSTYNVYTGGTLAGTVTDSLSTGGTYSAGTQIASFTISSIVTYEGSSRSSGFGRRGRW